MTIGTEKENEGIQDTENDIFRKKGLKFLEDQRNSVDLITMNLNMILKKDIYENISVLEESIPIYLYAMDTQMHEPNYSL